MSIPLTFRNVVVRAVTLRLAAAIAAAEAPSADYLKEQPVGAQHAMVVSVHHLAADAGVEIMREGGNAIDAAVATGFALAVVHPAAGNIGGGGFMLIRLHSGKSTFIDYREKAPLAATANMYLDAKGDVIPDASVVGYKAVGVPGSVAGMVYAEKKYGRLDLKRVMQPAFGSGASGFVSEHRRGCRAARSDASDVSRIEAHLPARRKLLPARRILPPA